MRLFKSTKSVYIYKSDSIIFVELFISIRNDLSLFVCLIHSQFSGKFLFFGSFSII